MMVDAIAIMATRKISELPVVDAEGQPLGLIDITDVVAILPKDAAAEPSQRFPRKLVPLRVVGQPDEQRSA